MKKLLFLLILLSFQKSFSQQYFPTIDSINEWNYQSLFLAVKLSSTLCNYGNNFIGGAFTEKTVGDTLIQSNSYKIIESSNGCILGYVREDAAQKRIYFMDNLFNPEIVLYDFSLQTGDTITISNVVNSPIHPSGVYSVDSIFNFYLPGGISRIFYLNGSNGGNTLIWIEGVGCPESFIYPYSYNDFGSYFQSCSGIQHLAEQFLICFNHDNKVYFDTCAFQLAQTPGYIFYDSCRYTNFSSEVNLINSGASKIKFTQSGNNLLVTSDDFEKQNISLKILNINSQSIYSNSFVLSAGESKNVAENRKFVSGIYLIVCKTNREVIRRKILFPTE